MWLSYLSIVPPTFNLRLKEGEGVIRQRDIKKNLQEKFNE